MEVGSAGASRHSEELELVGVGGQVAESSERREGKGKGASEL